MPKLKVRMIDIEDVYRDSARIPYQYRTDTEGDLIPEGRICKVSVNGCSRLLSLRGRLHEADSVIFIDSTARDALRLKVNSEYDFILEEVGWLGQFRWAWGASDPLYRVAARIGLLSLILGGIGLGLGIISIFVSYSSRSTGEIERPATPQLSPR